MRKRRLFDRSLSRPCLTLIAGLLAAQPLPMLVGFDHPAYAREKDLNAVESYIRKARDLLNSGEYRAAELELKNALREDSDNLEARQLLGQSAMRQGDPVAAMTHFQAMMNRGARPELVRPLMAQALLAQSKFEDALAQLSLDGLNGDTKLNYMMLRARALTGLKRFDDAMNSYNDVLNYRPDNPDVLLGLADVRRQQKQFPAAEGYLDKILAKEPGNLAVLLMKADMRRVQNDLDGSRQLYDKTLGLKPDLLPARLGLATIELARNNYDAALKQVAEAQKLAPNNPMVGYTQALILFGQGKLTEAQAVLTPIARSFGDQPQANLLLAELNLRLNNVDQALVLANAVYARDPQFPGVLRTLAVLYARKQDYRKVVELLDPVVSKGSDDNALVMLLGDALARTGDFDRAGKLLEQAASKAPDNTNLRTQLDLVRISSGNGEAGLADLAKLVDADPEKSGGAGMLLITTYLRNGQLKEAEALAEKLKKAQPRNPLPDNLLGVIHRQTGDWTRARKDFQAALAIQPGFMQAALNLALMAQADGKPEEAKQIFDTVIRNDVKAVGAYLALANLAQTAGDLAGAEGYLDHALQVDPKNLDLLLRQMDIQVAQKQPARALALIEKWVAANQGDPRGLDALARAQAVNGQTDAAITTWTALAGKNPDPIAGKLQLAQALVSVNKVDDAKAQLDAVLKAKPDIFIAWRARCMIDVQAKAVDKALATAAAAPEALQMVLKADVLAAAGRFAEADAAFGALLKQRNENGVLLRQAAVRKRNNDLAGSIALLRQWLAAHPEDAPVQEQLGASLIDAGDYAGATREYESLYKRNGSAMSVLNNLSWLYDRAGDPRALQLARRAYDLAPNDAAVADTLAWQMLKSGETTRGMAMLKLAHARLPDNADIAYHLAAGYWKLTDYAQAKAVLKPYLDKPAPFAERASAEALMKQLP